MVRLHGPRTLILVTVVSVMGAPVANVSSSGSSLRCTSQQVKTMPDRLAQMQHHFAQVGLVHEALIRGDLPGLRDPAKQLANLEQPPSVPPAAAQYVLAIRTAAKRAVDARDLPSAASATASMLLSCGNCHRATGTMPVPTTPKRADVGGLVGHMLEHQRAVDEMLEGLFIPSESQWIRGASRFRQAPLQRHQRADDAMDHFSSDEEQPDGEGCRGKTHPVLPASDLVVTLHARSGQLAPSQALRRGA